MAFKPAQPGDVPIGRGFGDAGASMTGHLQALRPSVQRHASAHVLAALTLAVALIVQSQVAGVSIDYAYGRDLFLTGFTYAAQIVAVLFVKRYLEFLFIDVKTHPARDALASLALTIFNRNSAVSHGNAVNMANFLVAFCVFASSFAALKASIALLHPFAWDEFFRDADRIMHFGYLPHELLSPILDRPFAVFGVNVLYNIWYFVVLGALFFAGYRDNDPYRLRLIVAFFAVWLFLGFFVAVVFSSAGPCFFQSAGFGPDYAPLMNKLADAKTYWPIWALNTQNILWSGMKGEIPVSLGISAFPSIHVASAVLIALWANQQGRKWGLLGAAYAFSILVGSVALGWHYAVDGYASIVLTLLIWKIVCITVPLDLGDEAASPVLRQAKPA